MSTRPNVLHDLQAILNGIRPIPKTALSIQQPWAGLIVDGVKPVENRTWSTDVRGWIAIHAGKKVDDDGIRWLDVHDIELSPSAPRGGIVGVAFLSRVVTASASPFFFGPYGFEFACAAPVPLIPCRGQLGFFDWTRDATPRPRAPKTLDLFGN